MDENELMDVELLPDKTVVATGVIGEGSCFLHAVVLGMSPVEYLQLTKHERKAFVKTIRKELADRMTVQELLKQESALIGIQQKLLKSLNAIRTGDNVGSVRILKALKNHTRLPASETEIMKFLHENIDSQALQNIAYSKELLGDFLENQELGRVILDKIIDFEMNKVVSNLRNVGVYIGDGSFKYIADKLGIFVVFINVDGTLYRYGVSREDFERAQRVILVKYLPNHFENIGIIDGGIMKRFFHPNDPLIAPIMVDIASHL